MTNSQSTRRTFLGNIAILSAGTAFGRVTGLLPVPEPATDLQRLWHQFYRPLGGRTNGETLPGENNTLSPGNGHSHKQGTVISFPDHHLLAQPTWVYWNGQKKAADVIVTFCNRAGEKQFRLNRFELEALNRLATGNPGADIMALLKEAARNRFSSSGKKAPLVIQAKVTRSSRVHIHTKLVRNETSTRNQFIVQA